MNGNVAIEVHDSVLESLVADGDGLALVLNAYIHRSPGRPGVDAGSGWMQEARLHIGGGRGSISNAIQLLGGRVRVPGHTYHNIVPVPLACSGAVNVELHGFAGERISIDGDSLNIDVAGEATYVEDFPGVRV